MLTYEYGAVIALIEPDDNLVICEVPDDVITAAEVAESCGVTDTNKFAYLSLQDYSLAHFLYEEGFSISPTGVVSYDMEKAKKQAKDFLIRELGIQAPGILPGKFPRLLMILQASLAPEDRHADFVSHFNTLRTEFDGMASKFTQINSATTPSELAAVFDPRNVTPFPN